MDNRQDLFRCGYHSSSSFWQAVLGLILVKVGEHLWDMSYSLQKLLPAEGVGNGLCSGHISLTKNTTGKGYGMKSAPC